MTLPSAMGPLGGKSHVDGMKYSGFAFAMVLKGPEEAGLEGTKVLISMASTFRTRRRTNLVTPKNTRSLKCEGRLGWDGLICREMWRWLCWVAVHTATAT